MEYEIISINISDLKTDKNTYRKISKKNKQKLKESLEKYGDVGIIVIDDQNNVLSGNMRVNCLKEIYDNNFIVKAKMYKNLTEEQKKQIILKNNLNYGEWDYIYDFFDIIKNENIKDLINVDINLAKEDDDKIIDELLKEKISMTPKGSTKFDEKEIVCPFCFKKFFIEE